MLQIDIIEENLERNVRNRFPADGYDSQHFAGLLKDETEHARRAELTLTRTSSVDFSTYYSPVFPSLFRTLESSEFKAKKASKVSLESPILFADKDYQATGFVYKVNVDPDSSLGSFIIRDNVASERGTPGNSFMMYSVQGGFISTEKEIHLHDGFMFFNHSRFLKVYLTTLEKLWRESLQRETS